MYNSIDDMPMYNWDRVHRGEYGFVLHNPIKPNSFQKSRLVKVWERIYESYIERFGFSENFILMHRQKVKIAKLQAKLVVSADRTIEPMIKVAQMELEKMKSEENTMEFFESVANLSKALGFKIDTRMTTVAEYFSYVKSAMKQSHGRR